MEKVDVAVIGAGVMGCAVARELSRYKLDVLVLERAHDVGEGSSKANSGIVHAGFHPRGGSLKGRSCVEGNAAFPQLCAELQVPFVRSGGMMVAFDEGGVEKLREKARRAQLNGAGELPIVDGDAARRIEPRLSQRVIAAMVADSTGIVTPFDLVLGLAQNAARNGVRFRFNARVERIERATGAGDGCTAEGGRRYVLHLEDGGAVAARFVANMAGDAAHVMDAQVHPADYVVRPRLGEYVVFDKQDPARAVTHVIYQAAEHDEGGTLLAPTVEGNLLAGPTSVNVRRFDDTASTARGIAHVVGVAKKIIPDLDEGRIIANFAGVRANIVNVSKELKDFVVRVSAPGFVSALGIKNPGLTSSPALACLAVRLLAEEGMRLEEDPAFDPHRQRYVPFLQRDGAEQKRLMEADEAYARVICRCEGVTAGDVRAVMAQPLPPSTMAGVKRRLRCGMGRCQGAFCQPRVAAVMADALGVPQRSVPAGERGGRFVLRSVK